MSVFFMKVKLDSIQKLSNIQRFHNLDQNSLANQQHYTKIESFQKKKSNITFWHLFKYNKQNLNFNEGAGY